MELTSDALTATGQVRGGRFPDPSPLSTAASRGDLPGGKPASLAGVAHLELATGRDRVWLGVGQPCVGPK